MQPVTVFEAHFNAAQALLKVYRLLDSDSHLDAVILPKLREVFGCDPNEALALLLNDLFVGLVREQANVPASFFAHANLSLLLRQAVVSACTAMDVFFPSLLEKHLPTVVEVRQRNFLPTDGDVRDLFKDFRLKLEDLPAILEEDDAAGRWNILARRVLDYCRERTLSNAQGIAASLLLLGINDPWKRIAECSGVPEQALRSQIQTLTKRRNNIIHRGDRPLGQLDGGPEAIDYAWANAHVNAVQSVVLACDALAGESVHHLMAEAGMI